MCRVQLIKLTKNNRSLEYQYGNTKGGINAGERISSPFGFDSIDTDYEAKANYTGARVIEDATVAAGETTVDVTPLWTSKTVDSRNPLDPRQDEADSVLIEVVKANGKVLKVADTADADHFTVTPKSGEAGTYTLTFASAFSADEATAIKFGYVYE